MTSHVTQVDFRGDSIWAVERDDGIYVAIKPICDRLGIAWQKQLERLKRDTILAEGITIMVIPSVGGAQETTLLRLDLVNGWLFGIDESRVKDEETRQKVLLYKRECYRVLFEHFFGGAMKRATEQRYGHDGHTFAEASNDPPILWPLGYKIAMIRETRLVYGIGRAAQLWPNLGLPVPPELPPTPMQEADADALACVRHLLDHMEDDKSIRELIELAMEGGENARAILLGTGIRAGAEITGGFYVANRNRFLGQIFYGTRWDNWRYRWALRRLPGSHVPGRDRSFRFDGHNARVTFIPERYLAPSIEN